jgi:hypothetical protein
MDLSCSMNGGDEVADVLSDPDATADMNGGDEA